MEPKWITVKFAYRLFTVDTVNAGILGNARSDQKLRLRITKSRIAADQTAFVSCAAAEGWTLSTDVYT